MSERGRILVANHEGTYLLRFEGDVRLTLCVAIDEFLQQMFEDPHFAAVVVDLSNAQGLDSTALGILATLAKQANARTGAKPLLVCPRDDLVQGLINLGIDELFERTESRLADAAPVTVIESSAVDEQATRRRVLDAHRMLMSLNAGNRETFKDLVAKLEALDLAGRPGQSAGQQ